MPQLSAAALIRMKDREREQLAKKRKRVDAISDRLHDARHSVRLSVRRVARLSKRIEKAKTREVDDISERGLAFIARWEGLLHRCYEDVAGHATIGVGHLLHFGPCTAADNQLVWTEEKAYDVLREDAKLAINAVLDYIDVPLTQAQFDMLVSFAFNCGAGALRDSTLRRRLNAGEYNTVPSELLRWNKAGGVPVEGLTNRRKAEGAIFANGY